MCVVSNVGDNWGRKDFWPNWPDQVIPFPTPTTAPLPNTIPAQRRIETAISRSEFDELKKMVEQMIAELRAAKAQDIADGNPDCEMEEKVSVIKQIVRMFGLTIEDVFPNDK